MDRNSRRTPRSSHQDGFGRFSSAGLGEIHPLYLIAGCQPAESDRRTVENEEELSAELKEFIDQLIVPLLVERLVAEMDLYTEPPSYYDETKAA
jgi:hypothetical protein